MVRTLFILLTVLVPVAIAGNGGKLGADGNASGAGLPSAERMIPGSLTTIFEANGGGAGQMFDITPHVFINEITGLDVNISTVGDLVEIEVYCKEGTCVGYELDETAWTLFATGTGLSMGWDNPTFIDLAGNGRRFEPKQKYGMYVHLKNYPSVDGYLVRTNGGPETYANTEMSLTTHSSNLYPAFTSKFLYRIWNGTIYYDWDSPPPSLYVIPSSISAWDGGQATFTLTGGPEQLGKKYIIFASVSGTSPGFPLPGGLILPLNWDWYSMLILDLVMTGNPLLDGFIGEFTHSVQAEATITLPGGLPITGGFGGYFAWCTYNPFNFVSVPAPLEITGAPEPPSSYGYDDGTAEVGLGWTREGHAVWCHTFDAGIGDMIHTVSTTFGSAYTSQGPPNGDPCWVYVWEDPNDDGHPEDAVLVGEGSGQIANSNTTILNHYTLDSPASVVGRFFAACHCWQGVGVYAAPLDDDGSYDKNTVWFMGGDLFDKNDLSTTQLSTPGQLGEYGVWTLRANSN
jgi:hypothetical protein